MNASAQSSYLQISKTTASTPNPDLIFRAWSIIETERAQAMGYKVEIIVKRGKDNAGRQIYETKGKDREEHSGIC